MKSATVADLRNNFSRVSRWIEDGEAVRITRRGRTFATLNPSRRKTKQIEWPDLGARLDRMFPGGPPPGKPASEIVSESRGEY
ncbi:MAG: hypothetical protein PHC88_11510 [Terrimicrobiaceae bacterium]|nr:hypothetical protein [Terrimicrobiaceae bacterium]